MSFICSALQNTYQMPPRNHLFKSYVISFYFKVMAVLKKENEAQYEKMSLRKKVPKFDSTSFQVVKKNFEKFYFFLKKIFLGHPLEKNFFQKVKNLHFCTLFGLLLHLTPKILSRVFFQGGVIMTPSRRNPTFSEPIEFRVNHLILCGYLFH